MIRSRCPSIVFTLRQRVAVWLEQKAEHLRIDRVVVFAPPGFLEALHEAWSPRFAIQVEEHQGDLAHLRPGDLADHPCIAGLMADGQT